jgi:tetratricopeptide (TPR) repeat protein
MRYVLPLVFVPALSVAYGASAQQTAAPGDTAAQMDQAIADYRSGDLNHARQEFAMLHASNPKDVRAAVLLGYTYIKLERDAEAYDTLAPMEKGNESNLDLEYVLSYAMIRTGRADEGVPRMEKVARAKGAADAWMIAGMTRFDQRQFHEAQADAEEAIKIDPKFPRAQTLLGKCRYGFNDNEGALQAFEAALRTNANDVDANIYMGALRSKEGNYEAARQLLELALKLQPGIPIAQLELAKVYRAMGKRDDAVKILGGLEKANPDWLEVHLILSQLYYEVNRPEDGKREREIVARLRENPPATGLPKQ